MASEAVVAGFGMVSSLGCDVLTSCAAARAGLVRPQVLDYYRIRSAVEGIEEPVIGHPVSLLTQGFEGDARLGRLLQGALLDLMTQNQHSPWKEKLHRFYLSLPDHRRVQNGEMTDSDQDGSNQNRQIYLSQITKILAKALEISRWDGNSSIGFISTNGNIAGLEAIQAAVNDLMSGAVEVAIVLGADSLLDENTLRWLHQSDRLKCDGSPAGLQPGESGVALLLARDSDLGESQQCRLVLRNLVINNQGNSFLSGDSPTGDGLADALAMARKGYEHDRVWIISDQNGEVYRANDWGHAIVRLLALDQSYSTPALWYPAGSFGDTGSASALLAVCMVGCAFERGYSVADTALISSSNDDKKRGALTLSLN